MKVYILFDTEYDAIVGVHATEAGAEDAADEYAALNQIAVNVVEVAEWDVQE